MTLMEIFSRLRTKRLVDFCESKRLFTFLESGKTCAAVAKKYDWDLSAANRLLWAMVAAKVLRADNHHFVTIETWETQFNEIDPTVFNNLLKICYEYELTNNFEFKDWVKNGGNFFIEKFDQHTKIFGEENRGSLRYHILIINQFYRGDVIDAALKSNKAQVRLALNLDSDQIFDEYEKYGHILKVYADGFSAINTLGNLEMSSRLDFQIGARMLDIGGGNGNLAGIFARTHSEYSTYVIYDLPGTMKTLNSSREVELAKFMSKVEFRYGSFFRKADYLEGLERNEKFDIITLGWILHDWNNSDCIEILKKAKNHLAKNGKIILFEFLSDSQLRPSLALVDFLMLLMASGYERKLIEYVEIANNAGLNYLAHQNSTLGRDIIVLG